MTVMIAKGGKGYLSGRSSGTEYWIFGRLGKRLSSCNLVMNSLLIITVTMMMMEVMRVRTVFTESETRAHWR